MAKLDPDFRKTLDAAFDQAVNHLEHLDQTSIAATADLATLRERLHKPLARGGVAPEQVVRELNADVSGGLLGSAGGRFFGWVMGGALPAAVGADWLTSVWQQNSALYACSPAAAVVEETVGAWLKEILGLPETASFGLVTGCQMAHVTCLAAARHALLRRRGWDVESQGMFGAPAIRILSSSECHGSFERAVRLLGFGQSKVKLLPVDDQGRLVSEALERELKQDTAAPTLVLLQAGDINIGAYDDFEKLIPIAKRYAAWVHVDDRKSTRLNSSHLGNSYAVFCLKKKRTGLDVRPEQDVAADGRGRRGQADPRSRRRLVHQRPDPRLGHRQAVDGQLLRRPRRRRRPRPFPYTTQFP